MPRQTIPLPTRFAHLRGLAPKDKPTADKQVPAKVKAIVKPKAKAAKPTDCVDDAGSMSFAHLAGCSIAPALREKDREETDPAASWDSAMRAASRG